LPPAAVDTALSIHQTHFHPSLAFPAGGAELVAYFRSYQRLIDYWRSVLPADRFLEVDYEELTRAPESVIRRIIVACGLAWHDACLRPECNPRPVNTPSKWQPRRRSIATPSGAGDATNPGWGPCARSSTTGRNWTQVSPDRDWAEAAHLTGKTRCYTSAAQKLPSRCYAACASTLAAMAQFVRADRHTYLEPERTSPL
jgi:hypothetical protein